MATLDRIQIVKGDITEEDVDAIVNSANTELILGAGVAGAIRRKGGPTIIQECYDHGPVELGGVAVTGGGNLKAKFILHAAVMNLGEAPTEESIEKAFVNSLQYARKAQVKLLAVPALGTGIGGFPLDDAARLLTQAAFRFLKKSDYPQVVRFVLFDDLSYRLFKDTFDLEFNRI